MANGVIGAIDRRLLRMLPQEDVAAISSPGGVGVPGTTSISPDQFGTRHPAAFQLDTGLGPVYSDPFALQTIQAPQLGLEQGFSAVQRRLLAQQAAGLGQFIDPETGQLAQFGLGAHLGTGSGRRPAFFSAGRGIFGDLGLGGDDDITMRAREIGEAVKRRLEELTGAAPSQPQFQSPAPAPTILRRGRFGT